MEMVKHFAVGFGIVFIASKAATWLKTPNTATGKLPIENKTVQDYALPIAGGLGFVLARKFLGSSAA